jgi:formylmethanofuran dehydrogenase subunit E
MTVEYPQDLRKAIEFHGHMCAGLAIGYRAAKVAQAKLEAERPQDEELVAIVESDGCGIDAVQSVLGCTLGKGNLIYKDHGKQVFTVICRKRNKAVRIAMKGEVFHLSPEQGSVFERVFKGEASEEEKKTFQAFREERKEKILTMDEEALFKIEEVPPEVPEKARIFKSKTCHFCGEQVMEPRARLRDGQIACIPCAENYTRGW